MGIFQVEGGRSSLVLLQGSSGRGTLVPVGVRSIFFLAILNFLTAKF